MEGATTLTSFFALLILMTMLLSSCSRFGWLGCTSAKAFFSEGALLSFSLVERRLAWNLVHVTNQRQTRKQQMTMRTVSATKRLAPSTLLLFTYLVKALSEAKMSQKKKKAWRVTSRYLVILSAFARISALFLRVKRKSTRQASQKASRTTMTAPELLTTSLVVPKRESLEQQGPKEKPKKRATYLRLEAMGDSQSVVQPVEQKTVKQRQGTSQATETECSACFLGTMIRLRNSSTRDSTKMAAEALSQKPQLSAAMQLAGGKVVTSKLAEKETLGSSRGALQEPLCWQAASLCWPYASCSLLDWEQLSVSLWFCRLALYQISKLMERSSDWPCGRMVVVKSLAEREEKETAKLLLLSLSGREICSVTLITFFRGSLTILSKVSSTAAVRVHEERLLTTLHDQPSSMLQLEEQPSPLSVFPSSH